MKIRLPVLLLFLLTIPGVVSATEEVDRLIFLLDYIAADYEAAVSDGAIASAFEYAEMVDFAAQTLTGYETLRAAGAGAETLDELRQLNHEIARLAPVPTVSALASGLARRLIRDLDGVERPTSTPDLAHGARLYEEHCAACHGATGDGRGHADPEMEPPASSFRGERSESLSPHLIYAATTLGIDGTAMPSYDGALSARERWDIAFFLPTLREDFHPSENAPRVQFTLDELARHSMHSLLELADFELTRDEVDRLRLDPPAFEHPALHDVAGEATANASGPIDPALNVALALQESFAAVADRVLPSVVTVNAYTRSEGRAAGDGERSAWREATGEIERYPGFERVASATGFFVSEDGYLLSSLSTLQHDGQLAEVLSVELPDQLHVLSRLVGAEPTLDLAVLQLEVVSPLRPPRIVPIRIGDSDAIKVGHWTIALGDPWGPARSYSVGTLSGIALRQCYQEQLSATLMQSSVSIPEESYGGPLVDIHGRAIGINVPPPNAGERIPGGSQYALPINLAMNLFHALKIAESKRSPWLGFSVLELAAARRLAEQGSARSLPRTGVFIDDVHDPSPAADAGIEVGDSLVAVDGQRLFSPLDFQRALYLAGIDRTVELELYRDGKSFVRQLRVEARPGAIATR